MSAGMARPPSWSSDVVLERLVEVASRRRGWRGRCRGATSSEPPRARRGRSTTIDSKPAVAQLASRPGCARRGAGRRRWRDGPSGATPRRRAAGQPLGLGVVGGDLDDAVAGAGDAGLEARAGSGSASPRRDLGVVADGEDELAVGAGRDADWPDAGEAAEVRLKLAMLATLTRPVTTTWVVTRLALAAARPGLRVRDEAGQAGGEGVVVDASGSPRRRSASAARRRRPRPRRRRSRRSGRAPPGAGRRPRRRPRRARPAASASAAGGLDRGRRPRPRRSSWRRRPSARRSPRRRPRRRLGVGLGRARRLGVAARPAIGSAGSARRRRGRRRSASAVDRRRSGGSGRLSAIAASAVGSSSASRRSKKSAISASNAATRRWTRSIARSIDARRAPRARRRGRPCGRRSARRSPRGSGRSRPWTSRGSPATSSSAWRRSSAASSADRRGSARCAAFASAWNCSSVVVARRLGRGLHRPVRSARNLVGFWRRGAASAAAAVGVGRLHGRPRLAAASVDGGGSASAGLGASPGTGRRVDHVGPLGRPGRRLGRGPRIGSASAGRRHPAARRRRCRCWSELHGSRKPVRVSVVAMRVDPLRWTACGPMSGA